MNRAIVVLAVYVALIPAAAAHGADTAASFRAALVRALLARDTRAAHALIAFPLRVTLPGGQSMILREARALTGAAYSAVFTPDTVCTIVRGPLTDAGGTVTIGRSVVVAQRIDGALKVTQLRVIGPSAEARPAIRAALDLRFKGATRQVAGNLANDEADAYTVSMTAGATLQARLERFKGLDAVLRVTDSRGAPVNAKADGKRTWVAQVPASETYRVHVVRKAPFCDPPLTYLLTLTAR